MATAIDLLVPRPRQAASGERIGAGPSVGGGSEGPGDDLLLPPRPSLAVEAPATAAAPALARLRATLAARGLEPRAGSARADLRLRLVENPRLGAEGYRLRIGKEGAVLEAATAAGLFYAATTFGQWLCLHDHHRGDAGVVLPALVVDDAPDFADRGVLLDISRDKVPSLETLFALVDLLASLKVNQLQLYMEHTFAYPGHEKVWRDASPLTADEVRGLDAFCRDRFVELVPCQNSFGHFHRWLVHEPYRQLAECPEGVEHPFSREKEPFSLCPTDPGSLALLGELYDHLLPCFSSRRFDVGLDETLDLGLCRSAEACRQRGKENVYRDFVRGVHRLAAARGRSIQMWADVVLQAPPGAEQIAELPADITFLDWGYEADHPFAEEARRLGAAGHPFYLCPGTSSWLSFAGRVDNMLGNVAGAARAGCDAGATGLLLTDWGDRGHLQPLPAMLPGLVAGAGAAWNADAAAELDLIRLARQLDLWAAPGLGRTIVRLGNVYRLTGTPSRNGSALFYLLEAPEDGLEHPRYAGLDAAGLEAVRAEIGEARRDLAVIDEGAADALMRRELVWVADLLDLGARVGLARLEAGADVAVEALPARVKRALASDLGAAVDDHAPLWHARNRPGGQADSRAHLERALVRLRA